MPTQKKRARADESMVTEHAGIKHERDEESHFDFYYATGRATMAHSPLASIPKQGSPAGHTLETIVQRECLDFKPRLNTSSYVNVVFEPEEEKVALLGLRVNIADQTVYPSSFKLHDEVVNMIANMWHCPVPEDFDKYGVFPGAGTVGSTEACLLAGLALKFRWRSWFAKRKGLSEHSKEVRGTVPNLVMTSMFQAAWEKFFKYMDIEPRFLKPSIKDGTIQADKVADLCDEDTIGVVCVMGNHYSGQYDPVWEVDEVVTKLNKEKGWQIGIHVDAASGGFVAPWQAEVPAWDFRLPNVLSISCSGHKFGQSCCGTGWVVWRQRKDLSDHVAIEVSYLGGIGESYTLNFSRPASGIYVQFYKLMRLGWDGYSALTSNMMANAKAIRDGLKGMTHQGKPRFEILDAGDAACLPVVAARFNPDLKLPYDPIDFQHMLATHHWYVAGYKMSFHHPVTGESEALFCDESDDETMFRVVVKANLTRPLVDDLLEKITDVLKLMDLQAAGFKQLHAKDHTHRAC